MSWVQRVQQRYQWVPTETRRWVVAPRYGPAANWGEARDGTCAPGQWGPLQIPKAQWKSKRGGTPPACSAWSLQHLEGQGALVSGNAVGAVEVEQEVAHAQGAEHGDPQATCGGEAGVARRSRLSAST